MNFGEACEAFMLISFSVSWYWSIGKMIQTGTAAGKSLFFVILICSGYSFGIASKLFGWSSTGELSNLIWLYGWNLLVTGFDGFLVVRYSRYHQRQSSLKETEHTWHPPDWAMSSSGAPTGKLKGYLQHPKGL